MTTTFISRMPSRLLAVLAGGAAVVGLGACGGGSDVTRARLERSLPQTFSNLYVQQAAILGHNGITVQSLKARAQCDKGGPKVADHGPGADWLCQMYWNDPAVPLPDGSAKFELNVHSNDCYTAGGPSKFVGLLSITDTHGNDVPNPVFEFDGCFNPTGSNAPTGVNLPTPKAPPPGATPAPTPSPAALTLPAGVLKPDRHGQVAPQLSCSSGSAGCAGTLIARFGTRTLGQATFALAPGDKSTVPFTLSGSDLTNGGSLILTVKPVIGTVTRNFASLTVAKS
jgi:hypothetical protein